jgi:hypothetical protein
MNPVVLGALIGVIPGTLAAGLATWSSTRSAHLALAADHDRWLREKRADVYVDMLQFVREAEMRRHAIFVSNEVSSDIRHAIQEGYETYRRAETQQLVARIYAYTSNNATAAFFVVWYSDQGLWRLAEDNIEGKSLKISDELEQAKEDADKGTKDFYQSARNDLQALHL